MPTNPLEILNAVTSLNELFASGDTGQEARWRELQRWLDSHDEIGKLIKKCLDLEPDRVISVILDHYNIHEGAVQMVFSVRKMDYKAIRAATAETISKIQLLYHERAMKDGGKKKRLK